MSIHMISWALNHSRSQNGARLTLIAIADYAHDEDGVAWPSIATLCRKTNMSEASVHRAVAKLVELGELKVETAAGPHGANLYHVIMDGGSQSDTPTPLNMRAAPSHIETRTVSEPPENKTPPVPPKGDGQLTLTDHVTQESLDGWFTASEEGWTETVKPVRPEPGSDQDPGFVAFWSAYPRHVAKGSARKAWRMALRKGTSPGEIIAGAEHYRDDWRRKSRPIDYTCHPATWLNGERWLENGHEENNAKYVYSNNPYEN